MAKPLSESERVRERKRKRELVGVWKKENERGQMNELTT